MSIPDVADRHRRLIAYALLLLGGRYVVAAASRLADPALASILGWVEGGFAIAVIGFIAPVFIWKMRNLSSKDWHVYKGEDGVVADTIARAQSASWATLFLVLVMTEPLSRRIEGLSTGLVLEVLLATMVLSFAASFLYLDRDPVEDPADAADA